MVLRNLLSITFCVLVGCLWFSLFNLLYYTLFNINKLTRLTKKKRFHSLSLFRNTLKMNPRSVVLSTPLFHKYFFWGGRMGGGSGSHVTKWINEAELKVVHEPVRTSLFYCTVLLAFQFFQSNTVEKKVYIIYNNVVNSPSRAKYHPTLLGFPVLKVFLCSKWC